MTTETTKQTFATREQYETLLALKGLPHTIQSGFIRVEGAKGNRLYVAATKTVRRIDISGFEVSREIAKVPHVGVFGNVKQQMKMDGSSEDQLARFELLLGELIAQPAKVPAPKAPKAKKDKTLGAAPVKVPETDEAKEARKALIRKIALEKGVSVSSKSIAQAEEV